MNCWVAPTSMIEFAGVTTIVLNVTTDGVVNPEIVPDVAVIFALPTATPVAKPPELTVALAVVSELHVTDAVMFFVVESE